MSLALLGLPKSWHSYHDSLNGREKLQIGNVCGPIWYKKRSSRIPEIEFHPRVRMKKILHRLERERRAKGRNLKLGQNPSKGARRKTCPK